MRYYVVNSLAAGELEKKEIVRNTCTKNKTNMEKKSDVTKLLKGPFHF